MSMSPIYSPTSRPTSPPRAISPIPFSCQTRQPTLMNHNQTAYPDHQTFSSNQSSSTSYQSPSSSYQSHSSDHQQTFQPSYSAFGSPPFNQQQNFHLPLPTHQINQYHQYASYPAIPKGRPQPFSQHSPQPFSNSHSYMFNTMHPQRHLPQNQEPLPFQSLSSTPRKKRRPVTVSHVMECKNKAQDSLPYFAALLMRRLFAIEERQNKNVMGTHGMKRGVYVHKECLDPARIQLIKETVFKFYSVPESEIDHHWKNAINAMNEYLRRKNLNQTDIDFWSVEGENSTDEQLFYY